MKFIINNRIIKDGEPSFIVAEIGLSHEGSLGVALAFIDTVAECGVDAVKFQMHIADEEGTDKEKFRINTFPQDFTRSDYWKRTAFSEKEWKIIKEYTESKGLVFLCSPFSIKAFEVLEKLNIVAWKLSSGEMCNLPLLEKVVLTKKPVLLSTGMSNIKEIEWVVTFLNNNNVPFLIYQCVNMYPCPPEKIGLNMISEFKEKFNVPTGLSDHSGRSAASLAAVVLGANSIEVHVAWHKNYFGPDVSASITIDELCQLVTDIRYIEKSIHSSFDKNQQSNELQEIRDLFTKSIVASNDIIKGSTIKYSDLAFKKPGNGIPAASYNEIINKIALNNISKDQLILWEDLIDNG